jgi:hypothetical protein
MNASRCITGVRSWRATRAVTHIGAQDAGARTLVVTAREDLEIAREVRALVQA